MRRIGVVIVIATSSAACGRVGFGDARDGGAATPGDASATSDATTDARTGDSARDTAIATGLIDLNGGASWGGWTHVADSQTTGFWVNGNTDRVYAFYTTKFILDAAQTVTAPTIANTAPGDGTSLTGDTGDLFDGNWQAGDRILGIGVDYPGTTRMSRMFFQLDYDGTNVKAASSFGASDGVLQFDAGDSSSFFTSEVPADERFREFQYAVFTAVTDGADDYILPYMPPLPATPAGPSRSFVVLDVGSTQLAIHAQYLQDLDAMARLNGGAGDGEGTCGPNTLVTFTEDDFVTTEEYSQQVFPLGGCL